MIQAAANPRPRGRHEDNGHVVVARPGPALIAGNLEKIDGVEAVIAKLQLTHRPTAGVGNAHRGADDAAFIQRRVPGRF